MLSQKRPLDDDDVIEVYERELEEGVHDESMYDATHS